MPSIIRDVIDEPAKRMQVQTMLGDVASPRDSTRRTSTCGQRTPLQKVAAHFLRSHELRVAHCDDDPRGSFFDDVEQLCFRHGGRIWPQPLEHGLSHGERVAGHGGGISRCVALPTVTFQSAPACVLGLLFHHCWVPRSRCGRTPSAVDSHACVLLDDFVPGWGSWRRHGAVHGTLWRHGGTRCGCQFLSGNRFRSCNCASCDGLDTTSLRTWKWYFRALSLRRCHSLASTSGILVRFSRKSSSRCSTGTALGTAATGHHAC